MKSIWHKFCALLIIGTMILSLSACTLKPHQEMYEVAEEFSRALVKKDYKRLNKVSSKISEDCKDLMEDEFYLSYLEYTYNTMTCQVDAGSIDSSLWSDEGTINIIVSIADYRHFLDTNYNILLDVDLFTKAIDASESYSITIPLNLKKSDYGWRVTNGTEAIAIAYSWVDELDSMWDIASAIYDSRIVNAVRTPLDYSKCSWKTSDSNEASLYDFPTFENVSWIELDIDPDYNNMNVYYDVYRNSQLVYSSSLGANKGYFGELVQENVTNEYGYLTSGEYVIEFYDNGCLLLRDLCIVVTTIAD